VHVTTIDEVVAALVAGQAVVVPTDTVYGVAVDPSRPGATDRLFEVKERPTEAALPVLAADVEQAFSLTGDVPPTAVRLAAAFWPGGLTLVVPRRPGLGYDLGGVDDETIGVRVPDHDAVRSIARAVGPLACTSANLHGRPTPETAAGVAAELGSRVAVVLDGGTCAGAPSTVVSCTAEGVVVLREGRIPAAEIHAALA
jgi:tRNA threonylcarbamoyl adenosine modification protein (Sua5/YciO/YrdC/YwlC family)